MKKFQQWTVVVCILSFLLVIAGCSKPDSETLDGQSITFSDYHGKWVFINYWATWCKPCSKEIPELNEFYEQHKHKNAVVFGVDYDETVPNQILANSKLLDIHFPVLVTNPAEKLGINKDLKGLPATFVLNPTTNWR